MADVYSRGLGALGVVVLLTHTGCDGGTPSEGAEDPLGADSPRAVEGNGAQLNGFRLNGFRLNGFRLNGFRLNAAGLGSDVDEATFIEMLDVGLKGGREFDEAWLDGSKLQIVDSEGVSVEDHEIKHVRLHFDLQEKMNGKTKYGKTVKLQQVALLSPGSDVWLYDAMVKENGGAWEPLCTDAEGGGTEAILLGNVWDPNTGARAAYSDGAVTFACRGAALAKCVEWGYRPWATFGGVDLGDLHQACTRMVRADYCGVGEPHTFDGTPVHVLDPLGIQDADPNFTYAVEAEWGPEGATCLNAEFARHPEFEIGCDIPRCGESFASGGLIQSGKILSGP